MAITTLIYFVGIEANYLQKSVLHKSQTDMFELFSRSLIEAIIRGGAKRERKSRLLSSFTSLDIFEAALLHRIVQNLEKHEVVK